MKREGFCKLIRDITDNYQLSIEERIDRVFEILDNYHDLNKNKKEDYEVIAFSELIEMIKKENKNHEFDLQLLQLITLLAERYVQNKEFRNLKEIALATLELLREESTSFDSLEYTIPRIIDALEYSVYNHFLYEILLWFIKEAYRSNKLDEELKTEVKKFLKLNILLEFNDIPSGLLDKKLKEAITTLLEPGELMDIILNPSLDTLKVDPVEYTWEWENIYYNLEDELDSLLKGIPKGMGFCYHYWSVKEDLLKKKYKINWKSPKMMNPRVMFD